jgi:putative transposase
VGVASLLTTSDGTHIENPRHAAAVATRLEAAQRALARCRRGSRRRGKVRERLAAVHGKVRRQRLDHAHKTALDLVRAYDLIAHEDLAIRNMLRTPAPKPDSDEPGGFLPNGRAAKAGLNKSIQNAGWGVFLSILAYKAASAGRELIAVDPRNTSRTCPHCGHAAKENRVTQAEFRCVACGHTAHADVVGALNVLRAGLARRDTAPAA